MCDTKKCKAPSLYWVQTNLPEKAPHTTPNATVGAIHPERSALTCGRHLPATTRSLGAYADAYLAGPGSTVAYAWRGLVIKREAQNGAWR